MAKLQFLELIKFGRDIQKVEGPIDFSSAENVTKFLKSPEELSLLTLPDNEEGFKALKALIDESPIDENLEVDFEEYHLNANLVNLKEFDTETASLTFEVDNNHEKNVTNGTGGKAFLRILPVNAYAFKEVELLNAKSCLFSTKSYITSDESNFIFITPTYKHTLNDYLNDRRIRQNVEPQLVCEMILDIFDELHDENIAVRSFDEESFILLENKNVKESKFNIQLKDLGLVKRLAVNPEKEDSGWESDEIHYENMVIDKKDYLKNVKMEDLNEIPVEEQFERVSHFFNDHL